MEWQNVGNYVEKTTSILGKLLGGPIGIGVEEVGALIANVLGVDATPNDVLKYLKNNPEAIVQLKELEQKEKEQLFQLRIAQIQAEVADRASARESAVSAGVYDKTVYISFMIIILMFIFEAGVIFFGQRITIAPEIVGRVLGTIDAMAMFAGNYIWGSTKDAKDNTYMLYRSSPIVGMGQK